MGILTNLFHRVVQRERDAADVRDMTQLQESDLALSKSEVAELTSARPGVRRQLVAMAGEFGVTEAEIDKDRWRALEIVNACAHCEHSKACYQYLAGEAIAGFDAGKCPNATRYQDLSRGS